MLPYLLIDFMIFFIGMYLISKPILNKKTYKVIELKKGKIFIPRFLERCLEVLIFLLAMCRGAFTSDYQAYYDMFYEMKEKTFWEIIFEGNYVEKGYLLLNKIVSLFTSNGFFAMAFFSFLLLFLILKEAKKHVRQYWLFLLLFVNVGIYYHSFNLLRQALAAAIIFAGTTYLIEKKYTKYIGVILVATLIHTSSIVMLACIPLMHRQINFKNICQYMGMGIVAFLCLDGVVLIVQKFRYTNYSYGMTEGKITGIIVPLIIVIFILFSCRMKFIDVTLIENRVFLNATIIYTIVCILQMKIYQMSRIGYFFSTYALVLCTNCIDKSKGTKFRKILFIVISLLTIAYMYVWLSGTGYEPYYTFWKE